MPAIYDDNEMKIIYFLSVSTQSSNIYSLSCHPKDVCVVQFYCVSNDSALQLYSCTKPAS